MKGAVEIPDFVDPVAFHERFLEPSLFKLGRSLSQVPDGGHKMGGKEGGDEKRGRESYEQPQEQVSAQPHEASERLVTVLFDHQIPVRPCHLAVSSQNRNSSVVQTSVSSLRLGEDLLKASVPQDVFRQNPFGIPVGQEGACLIHQIALAGSAERQVQDARKNGFRIDAGPARTDHGAAAVTNRNGDPEYRASAVLRQHRRRERKGRPAKHS